MILTISGTPGSGKSTVAKLLAQKLGLKHYSTGDFMREIAHERGLSLEDLGDLAKTDYSIDQALDERQERLGKEEDNFIIDGRLSFKFIPHSIKIFIDAGVQKRAERILNDAKKGLRREEQAATLQEMIKLIETRRRVEIERYQQYYHLNPYNKSNYDLVIDSSSITAEEVAARIIEFVRQRKNRF